MFQIIPSIVNRKVFKTIPNLKNLVQYISSKDNREEISDLLRARELGKNHDEYTSIKKNKLPCTTINFNFKNNYIKGQNIDAPTGYLYIDIDNITDIQFDTDYICAYWKSLSNNGYTVIVKVEGLDRNNFKLATLEIAKSLNLPCDAAAISIDRLTVLSYDENAYYNENVDTININHLLSSIKKDIPTNTTPKLDDTKVSQHSIIKKSNQLGYYRNGTKIRFDNLEEMKSNINVVYNDSGVCDLRQNKLNYTKVYFPAKVKIGRREKLLKSFAYNFFGLNPEIDRNNFEKYIFHLNKNNMEIPLPIKEVKSILSKVYKKSDEMELKTNANRRFFFDENKHFTKNEKQSLVAKNINKDRTQNSKTKIRNTLENWNFEEWGKMSIRNIATKSKTSKNTVSKYLKEIKEDLGFT